MSATIQAGLSAAIVKAQAAMGNAARDTEGNRAKYVDLASAREAVAAPLSENGLAIIQQPETDANGLVFVRTILIHESGEQMAHDGPHISVSADRGNSYAQAVGSAITYLRRYNLMAVCGIAPDDDDGAGAGKGSNSGPVNNAGQRGNQGEPAPNPSHERISSKRRTDAPQQDNDAPTDMEILPLEKADRHGVVRIDWKGWAEAYRAALYLSVDQPEPMSHLAELQMANAVHEAAFLDAASERESTLNWLSKHNGEVLRLIRGDAPQMEAAE